MPPASFPEFQMQNITKIKAEFKIEKKKHLLIEWTFFTNIQIICQIEARQRFLPYHAYTFWSLVLVQTREIMFRS